MSEVKKNTQKKSCWLWGFGCLGAFILVSSLVLNSVLFFFAIANVSGDATSTQAYPETVVEYSESSDDKIVIIGVQGVIQHEEGAADFFGAVQPSADTAIAQIRQAAADPSVKAVLLDVDSPGGTVSASDEIYNEVLKLKETGKIVVSHYGSTAASGAYYVSAPSDYILAEPTSLVGSIGVIFSSINFTELLENVGVREQVYKSGPHKDIFSSTRLPSEDEDKIMLSLVEDAYVRFVGIVNEHRSVSVSDQKIAFDGRIVSANDALTLGLIDEIGYRENSIDQAALLAGLTDYSVVEYEQPVTFGSLFGGVRALVNKKNALEMLADSTVNAQPELMYLWK